MKTLEEKKSNKWKEIGECLRCGFYLIKNSPTAKCAKNTCGFETSWEEYHNHFVYPEFRDMGSRI